MILTLSLDHSSEAVFEALRRAHFPPERNLVLAHVTLFHALPDEAGDTIRAGGTAVAAGTPPLPFETVGIMSLGRGAALRLAIEGFDDLMARLRDAWDVELTPQDRGRRVPHVTVQNKVDAETARRTLADLRAEYAPMAGTATGLRLWHYRGGPWAPIDAWAFAAGPVTSGAG